MPGPSDSFGLRLEQAVQVDDHIFHLGVVHRALRLSAPSLLGGGIAVVDADEVDAVHVEVEPARILDPTAEDQMKLAHDAELIEAVRKRVKACCARRPVPRRPKPWPCP